LNVRGSGVGIRVGVGDAVGAAVGVSVAGGSGLGSTVGSMVAVAGAGRGVVVSVGTWAILVGGAEKLRQTEAI